MIELGPLILLRPLWLGALPVAAGLAWLAARHADGLARWRRVIDPDFLPVLRELGHVTEAERPTRPWYLGLAAALLALGLSGPATRNPDAPLLRDLDAVMILLDLSPSVTGGGGLEDAQAAVSRLLDRHGTRPVALALYAGESFLVSVPTQAPETLQSVVAVLAADTMPVSGSRPDRALALAESTLRDAAAERPDIVLVSDGGGTGPVAQEIARRIAARGIRISAVYVAPGAAPYGLPPPDRTALERLAETGGGVLVDAGDTAPLEALLAQRRGRAATDTARRSVLFHDHGRIALALALVAMLPLFRQRITA